MNIYRATCVTLLLASISFALACSKKDLRGWARSSPDGRTYLVIDDGDGIQTGQYCSLDDKVWPYGVGERGEISPGTHELFCKTKVGFRVEAGTAFHLNYWGP